MSATTDRAPLKGQIVMLNWKGSTRYGRVARVWWKGDRPTRVLTSSGEHLKVSGMNAPGELLDGRFYTLHVTALDWDPPALTAEAA